MTITRARIVVCQPATVSAQRTRGSGAAVAWLAGEFPSVALEVETAGSEAASSEPTIDLDRWLDRRVDFAPFDAHVEDLARLGPLTLVVRGPEESAVQAAAEMLTRWQRLVERRNAASATRAFTELVARAHALHDMDKPLVLADWNHAVDTWRWVLRLEPHADAAVQAAALLHDIERLESEADARIEHLAPSYESFKARHAERGSHLARALLQACAFDAETTDRACALVAGHERPTDDPARRLINDADALSFFSQNSSGYRDYFGAEATSRKIAYSLGRMRDAARPRLGTVRLRADVRRLLDDVLTREGRRQAPRDTPKHEAR